MADGSIRIDTKIDNKGVKAGLNELTASLKNTKAKIKDTFNSFTNNTAEEQFKNISQEASRSSKVIESEMNRSSKGVDSLGDKLTKTENKLKSVETQIGIIADDAVEKYSMLNGKISDTQFDKLVQEEIDSNKQYQKLIEKQKELTAQAEIYKNKLENAKSKVKELNSELQVSKDTEQQQNVVDNQVGQQIKASKILDGITSQEQYNQKLEDTKEKLREIEQLTMQIANQQAHGNVTQAERLKQKALETNTEYQRLQAQLQTLENYQGKFTNETTKTAKAQKDIKNSTNSISKGISGGIKSLAKYALALLSIRSIYSVLSKTSNAWLNSTDSAAKQIKANFEYMSYAVGSTFKPILTWIQNALYKILSIIASIIKTFTGVNIFANAGAKAYANMANSASSVAKSTKETKNNIADFDDLSVLPDNNSNSGGGSSGGTGDVAPNIDLSNTDSFMSDWIDRIKEKLLRLFEPIKKSWSKYGDPLIKSIKYAFNSSLELIGAIGKSFEEVWTNGTGEHTVSAILKILTSIFNTIGNIRKAFKNAWQNNGGTKIIQQLWNGFNNLLDIINSVFETFEEWTASESFQTFANAIIDIINTLSGWFEKLTAKLKEIWDKGGKQTFEKLLQFISKLVQAISVVLKTLSPLVDFILDVVTPVIEGIVAAIGFVIDALSGVLDFIIGVFTGDWNKAWSGIKQFFEGTWNTIKTLLDTVLKFISDLWNKIWNGLKNTVTTIWNAIKISISNDINKIKDTISSILNGIKNICNTIWNSIKTTASNTWNGVKTIISNVVNGIKSSISKALDSIKQTWTKVWNSLKTTVSNIFNGIWSTIKKVINSILGGVEKMANGIIKGINGMIRALNKVSFNIPDWVPSLGGKKFGFNMSTLGTISLPRLAKGGIVNQPTQAIIGEAGREAVLPLENNTGWMDTMSEKIATKIANLLEGIIGGQTFEFNFNSTLAELIRLLQPELSAEANRKGAKLIINAK